MDRGDEKERYVRRTFDAIAPRYDRLNRLVSFNLDRRWRRDAAAALTTPGGHRFVDVGCGTGDLTLEIGRRAPGATVLGVDIATRMLPLARAKGARTLAAASGLALPVKDGTLDGIANAFVLRNLRDLDVFFREAYRALAPGGRLVSLEISRPPGRVFGPLYRLYFFRLMPRFARVVSGHPDAYRYLAESVKIVDAPEILADRMARAGFAVERRALMRGAVTLFVARK